MPTDANSHMLSVETFCQRNGMCTTNFYRAVKCDLIRPVRIFGRTLIPPEEEARFRQLAAEGKLRWPEEARRIRRRPRARPPRLGSPPLRRETADAGP